MEELCKITVVFLIILNLTKLSLAKEVLCENDLKICVCRYEDGDNLSVLHIDCSLTHDNILQNNYTLPKTVNTLIATSSNIEQVKRSELLNSVSMKRLLLNKNNINEIEIEALNLPNLEYLDLSENELEHFDPEIFKNVKKLKYLSLAYNKISTLDDMSFHNLGVLEEIVLSGNDIGGILKTKSLFSRNGLAITDSIKKISIADIKLNTIHDNLLTGYDTRYLKISNNNITTLPELPFTLEYLDFSDNPITDIYFEDFSNLVALKELQLNNLKIKQVRDFVFEPLKALKILGLGRNANLTKFSPLAFGNEVLDDADDFALEELSVHGSRLTTLSDKLEILFGHLRRLDLQGNRWKCDCNILWVRYLQMQSQDTEYLRCYLPVSLNNKKMFSLDKERFVCGENSFPLATIAVIAFCIIFSSMAVWFFVFIPKYQNRGYNIQSYIFPSAIYSPISTERHNEM